MLLEMELSYNQQLHCLKQKEQCNCLEINYINLIFEVLLLYILGLETNRN